MSQQIHPFFGSKERDDVIRKFVFADLIDKLIEMAHRFGRIRRFREKARELLDHCDGHPQPLLLVRVLNFASPTVRYEKLIPHLPANAADFHLVDVDASHCKRIRDSVEKSKSILGMCMHDSPVWRNLIVKVNLDWREQAAQWLVHPLHSFGEEAI